MKTINIVLTLSLSFTAFALQTQSKQTLLSGHEMMAGLAANCSETSWKIFSVWAQNNKLDQKNYSLHKAPPVSNGKIEFKKENLTVTPNAEGFQLAIADQFFQGTDACDVVNKIPENLRTTHWFLKKFFPMAQTNPVAQEPLAKETALIALSRILLTHAK